MTFIKRKKLYRVLPCLRSLFRTKFESYNESSFTGTVDIEQDGFLYVSPKGNRTGIYLIVDDQSYTLATSNDTTTNLDCSCMCIPVKKGWKVRLENCRYLYKEMWI